MVNNIRFAGRRSKPISRPYLLYLNSTSVRENLEKAADDRRMTVVKIVRMRCRDRLFAVVKSRMIVDKRI